jgi:hypothetical protein
VRLSDGLRYGLWCGVALTARRNKTEYGVPTAWLTHLAGNTVTLLLPEWVQLLRRVPAVAANKAWHPYMATLVRRVCDDPRYAGYVAPLALGFIASHPDFSIYHGRWAELTVLGFGADTVPHSSAAYAVARLESETLATFAAELARDHRLAPLARHAAAHPDLLAAATVLALTLLWELSEYRAHNAELAASGRDEREINMQWSLPDAITDSVSNLAGLLAAIAVRRRAARR